MSIAFAMVLAAALALGTFWGTAQAAAASLKLVELSINESVVPVGETAQLQVKGVLSDGTTADLSQVEITYSSSNPGVATIDDRGIVTGVSVGTSTIEAAVVSHGTTVVGTLLIGVPERALAVADFTFDAEYGSEGASVKKVGPNHFIFYRKNNPQFEVPANYKGNSLIIDIPMAPRHPGHKNVFAYSYDGDSWMPIFEDYLEEEGMRRITLPPTTETDHLYFGWQFPLSYEKSVSLMQGWASDPATAKYVTIHKIGETIEGRDMFRMEITDPDSPYPREDRWVNYVANPHPGEGKARWRMVGMIDWLLSDAGADFRKRSIWEFVLMMNPDGVNAGYHRNNMQGIDMNRAYQVAGAHPGQGHEPYIIQKDIENFMAGDTPLTTYWDLHVWPERADPMLSPGPEFGSGMGKLGSWMSLRDLIERNDPDDLVAPMRLRSTSNTTMWDTGVHAQFGITTSIVEGGGWLYTQEMNIESGRVLMKSLAEFYRGTKRSVLNLQIKQPESDQTVKGVVPVVVEFSIPTDYEVKKLQVSVDQTVLFAGVTPPTSLELNTVNLTDGRHFIEAVVEDADGRETKTTTFFTVENYWRDFDPLAPPVESAWFGLVDRSKTSAESGGWTYASAEAQQAEVTRKVRLADTTEYLVYEAPRLQSFTVEIVVSDPAIAAKAVETAVSADGVNWESVPFSVSTKAGEEAWFTATLKGEIDPSNEIGFFRVLCKEGVAAEAIQFESVDLQGWQE